MFIIEQHTKSPLKWWFSQIENIELNPPYQRRSDIWPVKDQQFLIDTIINRFDIPKFYVADFTSVNATLDKSGKLYSVIDGKQRFEAIFKFFKGEINLAPDLVYLANRSLRLAGLSYQDIVGNYPEVAQIINDYTITVMNVITDAEDDSNIKEMFIRVNKGEQRSGAEKRNAASGPVPTIVRALAKHPFFLNNIKFSVGRGQDLNAAVKLLLIEYRKKLDNTKKINLDKFVQQAEDAAVQGLRGLGTLSMFPEETSETSFTEAYLRTEQNLYVMTEVFSNQDTLLSGAGSLPLYYWFVRNQASEHKRFLHEFLVSFERERLRNRALAKIEATTDRTLFSQKATIDQEMLSYDLSNRSPDDVSSLELRYRILEKRLVQFIQNATSPSIS